MQLFLDLRRSIVFPGGRRRGRRLPHEKVGDARRIKLLNETNLGVVRALFDSYKTIPPIERSCYFEGILKPWPSRRKFSACNLRLLATPFGQALRALALTYYNLSPDQKDSQVAASSHKLNLRRDLRWVAKRTRKFPRKYTQVAKNYIKAVISQT